MVQTSSAEEKKLFSSFESIKRELQRVEFADRLDKPLAYWALPNDRRLPLAFLGRSIGELVSTPFEELSRTRGVGQKKIGSLVKLLHRATSESPPSAPFGLPELVETLASVGTADNPKAESFDPATVSEALWSAWCETVRRFHLEYVPIGRVASTLQALPTVIWEAPLGDYSHRTLMEIRQMRTHGEKRVRVVMEVFYTVHHLLQNVPSVDHLAFRLVPAFVPRVEAFSQGILREGTTLTRVELDSGVIQPLLQQVRIDSGEMIYELVKQRLGVDGPQRSVREQADELGVTRARVYQMLEDCARITAVRWPEGGTQIAQLTQRADNEAKSLLRLILQIFFMSRQRSEEEAAMETALDEAMSSSLTAP